MKRGIPKFRAKTPARKPGGTVILGSSATAGDASAMSPSSPTSQSRRVEIRRQTSVTSARMSLAARRRMLQPSPPPDRPDEDRDAIDEASVRGGSRLEDN